MSKCVTDFLSAQLLKQVLGESLDALDLLVLSPERNTHDQLRQLLKEAYPLCSGEPDILSIAEVADLALLEGRRWPVVCLLWPDFSKNAGKPALAKAIVIRILARLRDLHADRVVHVEISNAESPESESLSWSMADSLALGFSRRSNMKSLEMHSEALQIQGLQIYEFDIRTYKPAPDWLNAKSWAHPEMWEKHRW